MRPQNFQKSQKTNFVGPIFLKISKMIQTPQNASRRIRMDPNASEQVRTGPNRSENSKKLAKTWKKITKVKEKIVTPRLISHGGAQSSIGMTQLVLPVFAKKKSNFWNAFKRVKTRLNALKRV